MWMRHVLLHDTIDTPSHTPAHTRLFEHTPPYNTTDDDILFWRSGSGIIQNELWMLKSYIAYAHCVKYQKLGGLYITLFEPSIMQEITMFTWSMWANLLSMFCTLFAFIQSETSSGNILFAMSIAFDSGYIASAALGFS